VRFVCVLHYVPAFAKAHSHPQLLVCGEQRLPIAGSVACAREKVAVVCRISRSFQSVVYVLVAVVLAVAWTVLAVASVSIAGASAVGMPYANFAYYFQRLQICSLMPWKVSFFFPFS
jgi:hypothetical protein